MVSLPMRLRPWSRGCSSPPQAYTPFEAGKYGHPPTYPHLKGGGCRMNVAIRGGSGVLALTGAHLGHMPRTQVQDTPMRSKTTILSFPGADPTPGKRPKAAGASSQESAADIEEMRGRLAAIVESSDDAIIGETLEGIVTTWNRAAERLYGFAAEE